MNTICHTPDPFKNPQTMSSREIAELTDIRHDNVIRTIESLISKNLLEHPQFEEVRNHRNQAIKQCMLNKRDSLVLVARLSPEFTAAVIDRWQQLEMLQHSNTPVITDQLAFVESLTKALNMSDSGKLGVYQRVAQYNHIPLDILPSYTVDAPDGSTDDSSEATFSASQGLKEYNIRVSAIAFNRLLSEHGILERLDRKSSRKKIKQFWSITRDGLRYGKNLTNPNNQKETQAHWYRSTFRDLLVVVGLVEEAA
ncbi:Rha family transcriptional regulator [Photobacterium sp. OFAV2-7]|uniref:Rha family transcriptional regulator n=1 Tax=Photobacterium sp. OFAV2-7 TaxID=2917748 RepID=UPI001EF5F6A3|nr:Rha family transcriptional regulator [Photobacterium sp. OFAV2-7]MCG7588009.1 Rha family transcriptional regulator [Photobacterium sp. OFAV2-7]